MASNLFGSAFNFLNSSLIPDEIPNTDVYDEYGFRKCSHPNGCEDVSLEIAEANYETGKESWMKFLEEKFQRLAPKGCVDIVKFDPSIIDNPTRCVIFKLLEVNSIPNDLRPFFWPRLSQALALKNERNWTLSSLRDGAPRQSFNEKQISQLLPGNVCFEHRSTLCVQRFQNCIDIVQHQINQQHNFAPEYEINEWNLNTICAHLLLVCNEEDTLWILLKLSSLPVLQFCVNLVVQLLDTCCPTVANITAQHEIDFSHILLPWFSSLFAGSLPNGHLLFAFWDLFFAEGPIFLAEFSIGLFIIEGNVLTTSMDSAQVFNALSDLPETAFKKASECEWWSVADEMLHKLRFIWRTGKNVCNQVSSVSSLLLNYTRDFTTVQELSSESCNLEAKHVKQTALMMRLHEAVVALKDHFQSYNPHVKYDLEPAFDADDTTDDINNRLRTHRHKRAKALMDFSAETGDELEFQSNDIVTVLNEQDEHCWIGELDNRIGWFPAKLVELLDERDQEYSVAGDDRVVPFINVLVRGKLCSTLKAILVSDIRRLSYFQPTHPWSVFEELSDQLRGQSDFRVLYSRLVLNCTFHLDEYSRILKPIELLYRSVASINKTHENMPLDVKFRSLVCLGLNQYCLHDWFELLARAAELNLSKYYGKESFFRTPVWRLIKAELKLLVQFSFHLNVKSEIELIKNAGKDSLPQNSESPITKESVCDMLVKYHLFSWDSI